MGVKYFSLIIISEFYRLPCGSLQEANRHVEISLYTDANLVNLGSSEMLQNHH